VIGFFKQKSPGNIAVLLIFGLLLKLPLFLYPKLITATNNDGQLYQWLIGSFKNTAVTNSLFFSVVSFGLLYAQALMLNYLVNEYRMIARQTFLAAMAYLLITSLLPEWNYMSSPLLANTLIIWIFIKLFRLYNAPNSRAQVYNIGLLAGISSYIYLPSALFILCILLGLVILKPFRINEIVLFLLGCLTPYYFYGIYLFLAAKFNLANFIPHVSVEVPVIDNSIELAASVLLLTLPFLIGGYYVQTHLRKMLIQTRKNWSILLLYLLLAFFVPFFNSYHSYHTWVLITVPFAAFHACAYFYPPKAWLPLLLFFSTVGFVFYQQYWAQAWR
jgi:hypothetical protein